AERVAVHLPQQDRLALLGGLPARLPQVGQPGDLLPLLLLRPRPDQPVERVEPPRRHRLGRRASGADGPPGQDAPTGPLTPPLRSFRAKVYCPWPAPPTQRPEAPGASGLPRPGSPRLGGWALHLQFVAIRARKGPAGQREGESWPC